MVVALIPADVVSHMPRMMVRRASASGFRVKSVCSGRWRGRNTLAQGIDLIPASRRNVEGRAFQLACRDRVFATADTWRYAL